MEIISQPIQTAWRNKRAKAETTPGCATGTARSLGLANRRGFTVSRGGSGPIAKSAARSIPARVQLVLLGTTVPSDTLTVPDWFFAPWRVSRAFRIRARPTRRPESPLCWLPAQLSLGIVTQRSKLLPIRRPSVPLVNLPKIREVKMFQELRNLG